MPDYGQPVTFGNTGTGTQNNNFLEGTCNASSFILAEPGNLTQITVRFVSIGTTTLAHGAVYADSSLLPGARLGKTADRNITSGDTGLQDFTFASALSLAGGTYWLAVGFSGGANVSIRGDSNTGLSQLKAAPDPDPFGTPTTNFEGPICIYATYTPSVPRSPILDYDYSR